MTKVRLGIIGVGNMGSGHAANILAGKCPEIELTAVADRREARRQWAKDTLPEGTAIFEEGSDLIQSGLCDAVHICTPHYQHPTLAMEAFAAGLHVMCEKPAGVYTKAVREMNEAAEKSGKVFAMMFNQRTNCVYRKMHEMVHSGQLGELKRVNWIITDWYRTQIYYDSGDWRATWEGEGGGVLLNQCPHQLDLLQWICGLPKTVQAFCQEGKWHDIEVEDDVTAYLEYPNGATGVFVTTTGDAPGTNRFEVTGTRGKLVCLDAGHFHPTEYISDKISSVLLFTKELLLHVSRPVRWDSDHVVTLDDELQNIAHALVRPGLLDRTHIGLDFFDGSINRIAAWAIGTRNMERALLIAHLEPTGQMAKMELEGDYTGRLAMMEELKSYPFAAVWDYYCLKEGVPVREAWLNEVRQYEKDVLSRRC